MSIFTNVKTQIHLPNAAEYYGVHVNRGGFASCLFHEERTPSMKLYNNHFHCYGLVNSTKAQAMLFVVGNVGEARTSEAIANALNFTKKKEIQTV